MAKKILITVIVLEAFQDKFDHKTQYSEGTELQVDKERADDLANRGLAKVKKVEITKDSIKEKDTEKADEVEKTEGAAPPDDENPETKTEEDE